MDDRTILANILWLSNNDEVDLEPSETDKRAIYKTVDDILRAGFYRKERHDKDN